MVAVNGMQLTERFPLAATPMFERPISVLPGTQVYFWGEDAPKLQALFRHLNGELRCERGTKLLDGIDVSEAGYLDLIKLGVSAASTRSRVFKSLTMEEHFRVRAAALSSERPAHFWLDTAREKFSVLRTVPRTVCGNFSGGEQQTLMLALASMGSPRVLILEEPWTGLSATARHEAQAVFQTLTKHGTAVLYISQDAPKDSDTMSAIIRI